MADREKIKTATIDEPIQEELIADVQPEKSRGARPARPARSRAKPKDSSATVQAVAKRIAEPAILLMRTGTAKISPQSPMSQEEAEAVVLPAGRIIKRQIDKHVKVKLDENTEDIVLIVSTIFMYLFRIILLSLQKKEQEMRDAAQKAHERATANPAMPTAPMPTRATNAYTPPMPPQQAQTGNGNGHNRPANALEVAALLGLGDRGEALV